MDFPNVIKIGPNRRKWSTQGRLIHLHSVERWSLLLLTLLTILPSFINCITNQRKLSKVIVSTKSSGHHPSNGNFSPSDLDTQAQTQVNVFLPGPQFCPETGRTICPEVRPYPLDTVYEVISTVDAKKFNFTTIFSDESMNDEEPRFPEPKIVYKIPVYERPPKAYYPAYHKAYVETEDNQHSLYEKTSVTQGVLLPPIYVKEADVNLGAIPTNFVHEVKDEDKQRKHKEYHDYGPPVAIDTSHQTPTGYITIDEDGGGQSKGKSRGGRGGRRRDQKSGKRPSTFGSTIIGPEFQRGSTQPGRFQDTPVYRERPVVVVRGQRNGHEDYFDEEPNIPNTNQNRNNNNGGHHYVRTNQWRPLPPTDRPLVHPTQRHEDSFDPRHHLGERKTSYDPRQRFEQIMVESGFSERRLPSTRRPESRSRTRKHLVRGKRQTLGPPPMMADDENLETDEICRTRTMFVTPKAALNDRSEWKYIVNVAERDPNLRQVVKVDVCASPGEICSNQITLPPGFASRCRQKYIKKRLLSLDGDGQGTSAENFFVPSCCVCEIIRNRG